MKPTPQTTEHWLDEMQQAFANAGAMAQQAKKPATSFAPMLVAINRDAKTQLPQISEHIAKHHNAGLTSVDAGEQVAFCLAYLDGNIFLKYIAQNEAEKVMHQLIANFSD